MLPVPEPQALAASGALQQRIRRELADSGNWLGFARYMELALYEPGLGYYASGAAKLGAPGDFATAPELGTLYARTLARQVAELLQPGESMLESGRAAARSRKRSSPSFPPRTTSSWRRAPSCARGNWPMHARSPGLPSCRAKPPNCYTNGIWMVI